MTHSAESDARLIADFVRRLRRVAVHPLVADDESGVPGALLQRLAGVEMTVTMTGEQPTLLEAPRPDEVQFESLAIRLRPFTLPKDRLYWATALNALDRLTNKLEGKRREAIDVLSARFRQQWTAATGRKGRMREYFVEVDGIKYTDVELAYAWLYQDLAHSHASTTGQIGLPTKFQAAVEVFSHIAIVAIHTLDHITRLCTLGVIELPPDAFTAPVRVRTTDPVMRVNNIADVVLDDNLDEIATFGPLRTQAEIADELNQKRYRFDARPASG